MPDRRRTGCTRGDLLIHRRIVVVADPNTHHYWGCITHSPVVTLVIGGSRFDRYCFTGNIDEAKRFLDLGLFISFTATITYPANDSQRQAVSAVPSEKILLETDCPFLVPASRRGQRNDPLTIFEIAQTIAEMKKIDQAEVLKLTTDNAVRLFGLNVAWYGNGGGIISWTG